jgi:hypothetical protein
MSGFLLYLIDRKSCMKKNYLVALFICLCFIAQAQIKTYEYKSEILTEESISKILEQKKQENISADELGILNKILHKRMQTQQENLVHGVSQQKNTQPNIVNSTSCVNPGFENGTNSDWTFGNANISGVALPCNACISGSFAINTVVTATSTISGQCTGGIDDYGSFAIVPPAGNYALLLNDATAGAKMQEAKYSFVVDTLSSIYTFQYAAVLNTGGSGHTNAMPYFYVDLTDYTTGSVITCSQYEVEAPIPPATIPGWYISPLTAGSAPQPVYYKPWTTVSLDLSSLIGHTVTATFLVSDCSNGGHFGYVYVDGNCNQLTAANTVNLCGGNALLCGPPGYATYSWTGPATGTTQCLSAQIVGTYTLNATSITGCPVPAITFTVLPAINPTANYTLTQNAAPNTWDAIPSYSSDVTNAVWYWGDGSSSSGLYPSHVYTTAGWYSICVSAFNSCGDSIQYCQNDSVYRVANNVSSSMVYINILNPTTNVNSKTEVNQIAVYPNPANNNVSISSVNSLGTILVFNSLGEIVSQTYSANIKTEIDLTKFPAGIYTVKVHNQYLKLVKE